MGAKLFLVIDGIVVLLLVWRLFSGRHLGRPTPLATDSADSDGHQAGNLRKNHIDVDFSGPGPDGGSRPLNCPFQYNGHTWDAFEVLGVPAGSNKDSCIRAMVDLRRNGQQNDAFLAALWAALQSYFS